MCTLAYWHHPRFSSGNNASSSSLPFWQLLYQYNADLVLVGHDHIYERFAPQDPNGNLDTARGIRQFTVGTGGKEHHSITHTAANSEVRDNKTYGVLKLTLHPIGYDWQFVPETGGVFTDSGTAPCHDGTPANTPTITFTPTITLTPTNTFTPTPTFTPTDTPTQTNVPTLGPSLTPTNTNIPTMTFTPSPTSAVSDLIFADGFESGNLSAWTTSSTNGSNLSVGPGAVLVGTNGLQATINTTTAMYVRDDSPNAEPRYRARFYFNPNSIAMATGDYDYILEGYFGSSNLNILRVQFTQSSVGYQLRARAYDSGLANWVNTPYVTISNTAHYVEVDWGNDGHLTFWVDGVVQGSLTGINNSIYTVDSVRLGPSFIVATATSGTYYIDAFESRRTTYIGSNIVP